MEKQHDREASHDTIIQGQAAIWRYLYNFVESSALKCAVELHIADIIHSHGSPITLSQIADGIGSPSLDIIYLTRVMKFLVHMKIFDESPPSDGGEILYSLTPSSTWLLHDYELSLVPHVKMLNHPPLLEPFSYLSRSVKEGGTSFCKAHGREIWDLVSVNLEINKIYNDGMECTARITSKAMISGYKDRFGSIRSMVDVGGGTGAAVAEIVKAYPHIKGTNLDLPHVIATAPMHHGVTHVGGDMFKSIPKADAVLMKWIMHNWSNEDCVKILKECKKAIPEKTGKVIIVDMVLQPDGDGLFDKLGLAMDIVMLTSFPGGKERTELEWKQVLEEGGFPRYNLDREIHSIWRSSKPIQSDLVWSLLTVNTIINREIHSIWRSLLVFSSKFQLFRVTNI